MQQKRCSVFPQSLPPICKSCQCGLRMLVVVTVAVVLLLMYQLEILKSAKLGYPQIALQAASLLKYGVASQPTINFSFLKLHRCGSGSMHNMLVNFAIKHNTSVALADCSAYQVFPYELSADLLLPLSPHHTGYNMFIDHVRYNRTASAEVLPADTVYITQIRHPFSHAFTVFAHIGKKLKQSYTEFLKDPAKNEKLIRFGGHCRKAKQPPRKLSASRNVMALELGYVKQSENNVSDFSVYLKQLDRQLLHVSILEELPASLVLLRHKMSWSVQDVLHLRLHHTGLGGKNISLDKEQYRIHQKWSSLDYALYDFFLQRHNREVAAQPPSFQQEVQEQIRVLEKFTSFCSSICDALSQVQQANITQVRHVMATTINFPSNQFYATFNVTYQDCTMHILREIVTKKVLKYHMYQDVCKDDPQLVKYLHLQCDVERHVLPGLYGKDIFELFQGKTCQPFKT